MEKPMVKFLLKTFRNMFLDTHVDSFNYFMHWLGTTFDGKRKPQRLLILYGQGNNGKSIVMDLYNNTFGEYYCWPLRSELLTRMSSGAGAATPELMSIGGKHLAIFSEIGQKETLNIQILKRLLGGERFSGRQLYKGEEQIDPICLYVILCNNLMDIPTSDESVWKRLELLKMPIRFYPKNHKFYDANDDYIKLANNKVGELKK